MLRRVIIRFLILAAILIIALLLLSRTSNSAPQEAAVSAKSETEEEGKARRKAKCQELCKEEGDYIFVIEMDGSVKKVKIAKWSWRPAAICLCEPHCSDAK